jgi:uncharacterized C2H2 Zn-finger protein
VRTVHEQRRDHACPQCDAAFGQASDLRVHVRTVHERAQERAQKQAQKQARRTKKSQVDSVLHQRSRMQAEDIERRMYENQDQKTEQERAILAIRPKFVASKRNNISFYYARSDASMIKNWVAAVPAFIPFFG